MSRRFDRSDGPSQRQLRAGENVRHILVEILTRREVHDPALESMTVTVGEVRMSPDLKHATAFVAGLGSHAPQEVADRLNHAAKAIRGELGRRLVSKFTPTVKFLPDTSYDEAMATSDLFHNPHVAQDLRGSSAGTGEDNS